MFIHETDFYHYTDSDEDREKVVAAINTIKVLSQKELDAIDYLLVKARDVVRMEWGFED